MKSTDRIKFYEKKLDEQLEVVHVKGNTLAVLQNNNNTRLIKITLTGSLFIHIHIFCN